ncbi:MAG TPA: N-6 DNA methylase [Anaerolineae bacterium]|nr:N-6 DNA methylase [Anaerolineae bacterium]HUM35337.1 N-6 DNA methylase [Anaerolineae bacterium]
MPKTNAYSTPSSWETRELLREKGQFWTPDWIAEPMAEYVLAGKGGLLFDPAVGAGAFFRAAKTIASENEFPVKCTGMEIDPIALAQGLEYGLDKDDIASVTMGDFVLQPPPTTFSAIVANPPYIRHHRISQETKARLKQLSIQILGKPLDGRAGLHVYFLIRALSLLENNGKLAFIMPADTCEGKFAYDLWTWITENFALDAVITFSPKASPFPNIDTNPLVFLIRKASPEDKFLWAKCCQPATNSLKSWIRSGFENIPEQDLFVIVRDLKEGLSTGLSREPLPNCDNGRYTLGDFVQIMRGIATGANDFFFMTTEQAVRLGIPDEYFVKAIGRTRDITGDEITNETVEMLDRRGRPTLLLSLNDANLESFPESIKQYLLEGERQGLPKRPLISQRKPWYKMEVRVPPPFLFTYLGRRNSRFIRNTASVVPLTGFLCVYPKNNDEKYTAQIWEILSHSDTIANLLKVGKSYGNGAIKVEPRLLERLPIPDHVIEQFGFPVQMRLFEQQEYYTIGNSK